VGVDPLDRSHASENAAAAIGTDGEFQQGYIVPARAWSVANDLGGHRAAVDVLPIWPGVVPADGFAVQKKRCYRFAELPGEFAVRAYLALLNLRAFGMEHSNCRFARRGDGIG
jgi:hypothetical protein